MDGIKKYLFLFLITCLPFSLPAYADQDTLNVWAPLPGRSHYRNEVSLAFVRKLQQVTGLPVSINGTEDPEALERACATFKADHLLVNAEEGYQLVDKYGYQVIAYGETPMAIFAKKTGSKNLSSIERLGFFRRTGMDRAVLRELPRAQLRDKLLGFATERSGLEALFNGRIDALIIPEHTVAKLGLDLKSQLRQVYRLHARGSLTFLVSPRLDVTVRERLRELYLSEDPFIQDLFINKAGLTLYPRAPARRSHRPTAAPATVSSLKGD